MAGIVVMKQPSALAVAPLLPHQVPEASVYVDCLLLLVQRPGAAEDVCLGLSQGIYFSPSFSFPYQKYLQGLERWLSG